jgi:hypothetical protein
MGGFTEEMQGIKWNPSILKIDKSNKTMSHSIPSMVMDLQTDAGVWSRCSTCEGSLRWGELGMRRFARVCIAEVGGWGGGWDWGSDNERWLTTRGVDARSVWKLQHHPLLNKVCRKLNDSFLFLFLTAYQRSLNSPLASRPDCLLLLLPLPEDSDIRRKSCFI